MRATISRQFHAQSFEISVTGLVDMPAAVLVAEHIQVAVSYYRYTRLSVDVMHAKLLVSAANRVGAALRAAEREGVEVMLHARERTRSCLMTEEEGKATRTIVRRIGFHP